MLEATIETYGGPFVDQEPVHNPQTQQSADQGNRVFRDVAQLTRTGIRAWVSFKTSAGSAGAYDPSDVNAWSIWGGSTSAKPTVEKTATGLYKVTFATSYLDELDNAETVSFSFASASHIADPAVIQAPGPQIASLTANTVSVAVFSSAWALSDHASAYTVVLNIR